jgi:hypothetical protein
MNPSDERARSPDARAVKTVTPPAPVRSAVESAFRTCPNCGRELLERKCKLYCPEPRCGYFLSCADTY